MFEQEKYAYRIHRQEIETLAKLSALISLLVEKDVFKIEEYNERKDEAIKHPTFVSLFSEIDKQVEQLDKMREDPGETLADIFSSMFGKQNDEKQSE